MSEQSKAKELRAKESGAKKELDLTTLYQLSYGLYVISAEAEGRESGCVVNTLTQVTAEPVQISVALNKNNYTAELVEKSGRFTAAVLSQETDMGLIANFGFRSGKDTDKFAGVEWARDCRGVKYPTENVTSVFSCRVVQVVDLGTHKMFIGVLEDCEKRIKAQPMTYAYYHQVKNGTTPKNASSYQEATSAKKGFKCTVCGYFEEAESLSEDYKCPICKIGREKFIRVE